MTPSIPKRPEDQPTDEELHAVNRLRLSAGMTPVHREYAKRNRMHRISDQAEAGLRDLAAKMGEYYYPGASVSGFLEALGLGMFEVTHREVPKE